MTHSFQSPLGVVSYVTFASVEGFAPLFSFPTSATVSGGVLALTALLGLIIAFVAVGFTWVFHRIKTLYGSMSSRLLVRFVIGGVVVGLLALAVRLYYKEA